MANFICKPKMEIGKDYRCFQDQELAPLFGERQNHCCAERSIETVPTTQSAYVNAVFRLFIGELVQKQGQAFSLFSLVRCCSGSENLGYYHNGGGKLWTFIKRSSYLHGRPFEKNHIGSVQVREVPEITVLKPHAKPGQQRPVRSHPYCEKFKCTGSWEEMIWNFIVDGLVS